MINDLGKKQLIYGVAAALLITMVSAALLLTKFSRANTVLFYPGSCLGSWRNPQNAVGAPDLTNPDRLIPELFTDANSAVFDGGISTIFCGNFSGDIPEETEIQSATLSLVIAAKSQPSQPLIIELPVIDPTSSPSPEPVEGPEISPSLESSPAPEESTYRNFQFSIFNFQFSRFLAPVAAQEASPETAPSPILEPSPEAETISGEELVPANEPLFYVRYSLNSVNWEHLGEIYAEDLENPAVLTFQIPVSNWVELQKIQISIVSLPRMSESPYVYLDGMRLEVSYRSLAPTPDREEMLPPDIAEELTAIKELAANVSSAVAVKVEKEGRYELWLWNTEADTRKLLSPSVAPDFPIGIKDGFLFWLSEDKGTLFAFSPDRNIRLTQSVPEFNPDRERARITFLEFPWEVIVGVDDFYFFSRQTGEVFSDGNSAVLESFRQKFNLDNFLTDEELSDLGFSIEQNE